jgi:putative hydroxymethylpyrimidine transport system substrate-binding protein
MITVALSVLLYWQSGPGEAQQAALPSSPVVSEYILKTNSALTPSSAGALIAIAEGLFQQEGLSVQLRPGKDDADVTAAVAADPHIIGIASAQGFLKARADGLPVVAFAASYMVNSLQFFALPGTRLIGPADLEGKRIGYKAGLEASTILYAFIAQNSIAQSGLKIEVSDSAASDLMGGKIDVLLGHIEVEGQELEKAGIPYRSLSPGAFGVHAMGPVYFANERAFSASHNLVKFFTAVAKGWNSAYSDYHQSIPIIARAIGEEPNFAQISLCMDAQRRLLRPYGARLGELDPQWFDFLQAQLLQQRIIQQPVDIARALNSNVLADVYRSKPVDFSNIGP